MAELVLSAVLPVLFDKLTSHELLKFATQEGVRSKLKKWEKTLNMITALLSDAEEKQLTNRAVKMWLEDLQDLAYDAEDILDEYATEALRRKLKIEEHQASTSRAWKLIPACCINSTPHALWSDFTMRCKIDGITSRLLDLCTQRIELGLVEIPTRRQTGLQRPPTTSSQIETVVYGRDEDKAKILKMLLSDEPGDANYGVVSIVGMGGVGKTTLAQHVYNDDAMTDFDPKGWVCISDEFDVTKISIAILQSITKSGTHLTDLDAVQNQLKEKLAGRKFLLVLDDVWNEDYSKWQILRSPFMVGARGSKIIVTTQHERVALTMGRSNGCHRLLGLSDNDCWSLFKKHAIDDEDLSSHPVELIHQKVAEKCKGLPLAARTLGGLLRSKEKDEWLDILSSKTWELLDKSKIPPTLQISYYHLPSHLKRCFAYCGILPKDYQFEEKELVLLWMAEGLIQQPNDNKQLEELGGATSIEHMPMGVKKWELLRTLSNFIVSKDSGSSLKDLKHLKFLCGELHISNLENVIVLENAVESILDDKKNLKVLLLEWGSRFDESQDEAMDKKILDILRPHQNLEKLTIRCYGGKTFSSWVGNSSFSKMTILKLEDCKKCTSLPSLGLLDSLESLTIKGMKGLKNIDYIFYGQHCSNPFKSLEILCFENLEECVFWDPVKENESFPRLQELSIINCPKLSGRLPNKLSSLEKLVIHGCEQLVVSISNIPKLCKLGLNKCKKIVCTSSTTLESLEYMTLSNILDFGDLSRQKLKKVQNLKIESCEELIELWQNEIFLEKLYQRAHNLSSLKKLYLSNCYTLTTLLEGIKQKNVHVEELRIENCDSLNFIFKGQLPQSLKKLRIEKCEQLQCLLGDTEDTSASLCSATFSLPSKEVNASTFHLEDLSIKGCSSLTCLPSIDQFSATLTSLHIEDCQELTALSLTGYLPVALKHLTIENCSELTTLSPRGPFPETLETLSISSCEQLESIVEKFHNNKALYGIHILNCENLKSLPGGLETLSSLKYLVITFCGGLASFPKGGFPDSNLKVELNGCNMLKALPSGIHTLSSLEIKYCPNMSLSEEDLSTKLKRLSVECLKQYKVLMERGFRNFTSLTHLSISEGWHGESFQETDMEFTLPPNLTQLRIICFPKLKCLPFKDFEHLSSLEHLFIECCPELTSLPSILPSSLLRLQIWDCPSLKEACKRDKGKEWPKIADIPCVLIDPEE